MREFMKFITRNPRSLLQGPRNLLWRKIHYSTGDLPQGPEVPGTVQRCSSVWVRLRIQAHKGEKGASYVGKWHLKLSQEQLYHINPLRMCLPGTRMSVDHQRIYTAFKIILTFQTSKRYKTVVYV